MQLTTTPKPRTLAELESIIEEGKSVFEQVGFAIAEVLARKLYQDKYKTFEAYCRERWGWSREHGYRLARAAKFLSEQKQIAEASGEPAQAISNENQARMLLRQARALKRTGRTIDVQTTVTSTQMPAKRDPDQPVGMMLTPPVEPTIVNGDLNKFPPDVVTMIEQALGYLLKVMRSSEITANADFRHAVALVQKVKDVVQPEFGFMRGMTARQKSRGSLEQCIEFCVNAGLTKDDGEWFFMKCEGCGWKNNGQPIIDWRMTVRAWQKVSYFPSQKVPVPAAGHSNGKLSGAEMVLRTRELEDCQKQIDLIRNSYDSHQSMRKPDVERMGVLKARRAELKTLLGVKV